jgi:hypothetical protein
MASPALIKQVASEFDWTQADVERAIKASEDGVTTRDGIIACMIRYAGPALLQRNHVLGAQKRVNNQQKEVIASLIEQLTSVQNFYATRMVPALKATMHEQAAQIAELLKQGSGKNQGGSNG